MGGLDPDKIKKKADDSFEQLLKILSIPLEKESEMGEEEPQS